MFHKFRTSGYHPIRKIKVVLSGLYLAIASDFSVAYKVALSIPLIAISLILNKWVDFNLILMATGLILMAELFNSAIEILCDFVESHQDERIGAIKDISAAAVGVSILVWTVTIILEISHLWILL
jgi:diacylglycerol kinase (ATP)